LPRMADSAIGNTLPDVGGAYALLIRLRDPAPLPGRFGGALQPGLYCYLGSAYGPGGIRARCRRHLTRDKATRWHVDWLTAEATAIEAVARPGLAECALVGAVLEIPGVTAPVAGFGSSDCRTCPAHLLAVPPELDMAHLRQALGDA